MFTPQQLDKLEGVLRRAADDGEYLKELSKDLRGVLSADADVDLPASATTRTIASDAADFTIVLSAKPGMAIDKQPMIAVVDRPGDYNQSALQAVAHIETVVPQIVEKSVTDASFRKALVSDPKGTLRKHFDIDVRSSLQVIDPLAADYTLIAPQRADGKHHPVIALPGYAGGRIDTAKTGVTLVLASEVSGELSGSELGAVAGGYTKYSTGSTGSTSSSTTSGSTKSGTSTTSSTSSGTTSGGSTKY